MSTSTDILLPTELERRQLFHWLKRVSSYTAWNRILDYHRRWVAVAEHSYQIASDKGWVVKYNTEGKAIAGVPEPRGGARPRFKGTAIGDERIVSILKALAHFEEGVKRLRLGDKRVFQRNAQGEFIIGTREQDYWITLIHRVSIGESGIDQEHTPLWDEFKAVMEPFNYATGECWPNIIEPFYADEAADSAFSTEVREALRHMAFPDPLPDVPEPDETVLVTTGKTVPYSGLWEPIEAPVKKGFSLFRGGDTPRGPFTPLGRMTYLHGGLPARTRYDRSCKGRYGSPCTWRLIWRDDRYEDGSIPAEEAEYVFKEPHTSTPVATASPHVKYAGMPTAESGEPAPQAGRWLVVEDLNTAIELDAGQRLPKHNGRDVRWVLAEQ